MGQSSSNRRRQEYHPSYHHHSSSPVPSSSNPFIIPPPPLAPGPQLSSALTPRSLPPNFAYAENAPYPSSRYPFPVPPPHFGALYPNNQGTVYRYAGPFLGHPNYPYYINHGNNGRSPVRPHSPALTQLAPPQPPVSYVEHKEAITVKNVVNVHRETICIEIDAENPDCHLVSFTFDAEVDGRITVYYFAKEEENCNFSSLYPYMAPVIVPFHKGPAQKFCQPSGTGIDLGFIEWDQLSKPLEDAYPLTISAEASLSLSSVDEQSDTSSCSINAQITQTVIERKSDGGFQARVVNQILWVNGVRYQLHEIFGIGGPVEAEFDDSESGKECIICMTESRNTAVLPCRHMCMCTECAKVLRFQSNKCPICRQPAEQLLEIKMKDDG